MERGGQATGDATFGKVKVSNGCETYGPELGPMALLIAASNDGHRSVSLAAAQFDRESFRKRLAKMTDSKLIRQGQATEEMCKSGFGEASRETFVIRLEGCRA